MKKLNETEQMIADYINYNLDNLRNLTASKIAKDTFSTTTSVYRLCVKWGYKSFTDFKFQKLTENVEEKGRIIDNNPIIIDFVDEVLSTNRNILICSKGASNVSSEYLSRFLSIKGINHFIVRDLHQVINTKNSLLLVISKSGETPALLEIARAANEKDIPIYSICPKSELKNLSEVNIEIEKKIMVSDYERESQLEIINIIDKIGKEMLEYNV